MHARKRYTPVEMYACKMHAHHAHSCVKYMPMRCASLTDVHRTGVHRTGMYFTAVYLMGVYLTGVHLTGVHIRGMYFTAVHLMGVYLLQLCMKVFART